jgi:hypothetical protein
MIKSFADKNTEDLYWDRPVGGGETLNAKYVESSSFSMRRRLCSRFAFLREIAWKHCLEIGRGSTQSGSMTNSGCVSVGTTATLTMWNCSIIIDAMC